MRCLEINKQPFWYALYQGKTDVLVDGKKTGEKVITYSTPVQVYGNISPASGTTVVELFGNNAQYDKIIVMDIDSCPPIDESSVLCIDKNPTYRMRGTGLIYDYVVKKVAKSLHHVVIAANKVTVG